MARPDRQEAAAPHEDSPPPATHTPPRARSPRAQGRRIALIVYYGMVALVGGAVAAQITRQVFFAPGSAPPYATCHDGLRALFDGVAGARAAAASSEGDEEVALDRFRSEIKRTWDHRDGVASQCRSSTVDSATLDAIERLRYAEEHAVRREAGELAPLRREVQRKVQALDGELGR